MIDLCEFVRPKVDGLSIVFCKERPDEPSRQAFLAAIASRRPITASIAASFACSTEEMA